MSKVSKISKLPVLEDQLLSAHLDEAGNVVELYKSGRRRVYVDFSNDPGLTEQSHKDSCDIQNILSMHVRMGGIPPMPEDRFVDLTQSVDYQTCLNKVLSIQELFEGLPLDARVAYDHDPAKFMLAVEDPKEREKLISLGIFEPNSSGVLPVDVKPDEGQAQ